MSGVRRGPKPMPSNVVGMIGNPGKRAMNRREPKASPRTTPPAWLDPIAKREWRRLYPVLERNELVGKEDRMMFALYCETASTIERSKIILEEAVRTVTCSGLMTIEQRIALLAGGAADEHETDITAAISRAVQEIKSTVAKSKKSGQGDAILYVPCGHQNTIDDDVCVFCGADLAQDQAMHPGYGLMRYASGAVAQHPALGNLNQAKKRLEQYAAHFGLSPSARRGLEAPQDGDQLPIQGLDDYKARRNGTIG